MKPDESPPKVTSGLFKIFKKDKKTEITVEESKTSADPNESNPIGSALHFGSLGESPKVRPSRHTKKRSAPKPPRDPSQMEEMSTVAEVEKIKSASNKAARIDDTNGLEDLIKPGETEKDKSESNGKSSDNGFHQEESFDESTPVQPDTNGHQTADLEEPCSAGPPKNVSSLFSSGALTIRVSDSVENLLPEKKVSPVEVKSPIVESDSTSGRSSSLSSYSTQPESTSTVSEGKQRQISPIATKFQPDYPRIPVKSFEEEYYRQHRTIEDGLEELDYRPSSQLVTAEVHHTKPQSIFRSSGVLVRSDLPTKPEPTHNRYASLPVVSTGETKPHGVVASVKVRQYPLEDRLNEEYSKLQRLFGAWQMQLKRNEAMLSYGADIPDGLLKEFNQLQTDMITQHQLVQRLCDEALRAERKSLRSDTILSDLRRTNEVIQGAKEPQLKSPQSDDSDSYVIIDRSNVVRPSQIFGPRVKIGGGVEQLDSSRKNFPVEPFIPNRRDVVSQSMMDMTKMTRSQYGTDKPNYTAKSRPTVSPGSYETSSNSTVADYRQMLRPAGLRRTSFNESTSPPKPNFYANAYSTGLRRSDLPRDINVYSSSASSRNNFVRTDPPVDHYSRNDPPRDPYSRSDPSRDTGNRHDPHRDNFNWKSNGHPTDHSPIEAMAEQKTPNRVHFDESAVKFSTPPPPPPPPLMAQMQQVSLKPASQRQLKKPTSTDPRDQLMNAIRNFGGAKGFGK